MPRRKPRDPERSPDLPHNWVERHLERLEEFVYYDEIALDDWQYRRARLTAAGSYDYLDNEWGSIKLGEQWGGHDVTAFFRKSVTVPESHAGNDTVLDIFMDGGETQFSIDGKPWQGLDWHRSIIPLGEFALAGRELDLGMEAFVINYPYDERRHDERDFHCFTRARFLKIDREIETFLRDARFVLDTYLSYWQNDDNLEIEGFLLHHLEEACRALGPEFSSRENARIKVRRASVILKEKIFDSKAYKHGGKLNICAHSHLDIVYLWPIKETFRKNARTATNQLSIMREFPEYKFTSSQPYLYEKMKEMYPSVYEEIKQRVNEGRWELVGAMYLEPDGNLLGGESYIRQILFGKKFFREEFGVETETCWLPDVFGVMYTLPQILRKSGIKYFTSIKLNIWNDTNDYPHHTFRWRGPDGSDVIVHFPPTHFGQEFKPQNLKKHWRDFHEKNVLGENLFMYGYADGGGGPTREMAASSLRVENFPGLPNGQIEFAEDFFRRVDEKADKLAVWDDELYLEAHRGTYTTKGDLKRQNRKAELLYRDAEILSSLAHIYGGPRMQERINEGWKYVMLNQFHDTLPGSHVPECTPDIKKDYEGAYGIGQAVLDDAVDFLASRIGKSPKNIVLFNTLSWDRSAMVELEDVSALSFKMESGKLVPAQSYGGKTWLQAELPSLGWTVAEVEDSPVVKADTAVFADAVIETAFYRIETGEAGALKRIYDKENDREVLSAPGNALQLFEDDPGYKFSAWDIAYHFEEYQYPLEELEPWTSAANGPLFAVFSCCIKLGESVLKQEMWLYAEDRRIDFKTHVDWKCKKKLLKVAFPLDVRSRRATYDLPFGNIERATHRNTSWEQAKFEVCGHKWADMSEGNYGVALMNDCKYGYDAKENVLRLSLLRAPIRPDAVSDQGEHEFVYSLLPHSGDWRAAAVDRSAYELNIPVTAAAGGEGTGELPSTSGFLQASSDSVIVEALKQAEDGEGLILRTFDSHGCHEKVNIDFDPGRELVSTEETNLMEEEAENITLNENKGITASFTPYEIKTHRLKFK